MTNEQDQSYLDYTVDAPVVRWKSNNAVPFEDKLQEFYIKGWITNYEFMNSNETRQQESARSLAEYIEARKNYVPDAEERYEMEAAFGKGVKVVDVISGVVTVI